MLMTSTKETNFRLLSYLNNDISTIKFVKLFSKFYYRYSELIVKYYICIKTLLQKGISEPVFYRDLVYKFKRIVGNPNLGDPFKRLLNVIKELDTTWILCNSLHAWLLTQSRFIAMVSALIE